MKTRKRKAEDAERDNMSPFTSLPNKVPKKDKKKKPTTDFSVPLDGYVNQRGDFIPLTPVVASTYG